MYQFLIADDHPLFREAIVDVVRKQFPDSTVLEAEDFVSAEKQLDEDIDLLLLDLNMPGMDGLNGLIQLRNHFPETPVAMISAEKDRDTVLHAITYGAVGFISKTTARNKIGEAIHEMLDGNVYLPSDIIRSEKESRSAPLEERHEIDLTLLESLTKRQLLVLQRMSTGESNKQIAYALNIAETTVKTHVSAILSKLQVNNRMQAVLCANKINFSQYLLPRRL